MADVIDERNDHFRWSFEEDVSRLRGGRHPGYRRLAAETLRLRPGPGRQLLRQSGLAVSHLFWAGGFTGTTAAVIAKASRMPPKPSARRRPGNPLPGRLQRRPGRPYLTTTPGGCCRAPWQNWPRWPSRWASPWPWSPCIRAAPPIGPSSPVWTTRWPCWMPSAAREVKIVLDTYHLGQIPGLVAAIPQIVRTLPWSNWAMPSGRPRANRTAAGWARASSFDGKSFALRTAGYDGYYDVELLGEELKRPITTNCSYTPATALPRCWGDRCDVAFRSAKWPLSRSERRQYFADSQCRVACTRSC